jgi:radical SAM protein with 4Fe4S-binding SPASM domain
MGTKYQESKTKRKLKVFLLGAYLKLKYLWKYQTTDFFDYINLETNTSCNRRCSYCPNSVFDRGLIKNEKLMSEEAFKKIIDELAEIKFTGKIIPCSFGEPLLDKRIFKFMKYVKNKLPKSKIYFMTNGDYLNEENRNKLVKIGVDKILVSPHDDVEYRESPLNNRGGLVAPKNLCSSPRCLLPDNPIVIDYKGDVILCCNDYHGAVKFGNIKKQKLVDIWNSKNYRKVRKDFKNKKFTFQICKNCVGMDQS